MLGCEMRGRSFGVVLAWLTIFSHHLAINGNCEFGVIIYGQRMSLQFVLDIMIDLGSLLSGITAF